MKKINKKLYTSLLIFLSIFIFLVATLFLKYTAKETRAHNVVEQKNINISISAGNISIKLQTTDGTSLFDALTQAKNAGKIELSGKNYPGLGFFVTDIGTLHSGNGKHLFYYINSKEASVGVSSYKLKDGDVIGWKLE